MAVTALINPWHGFRADGEDAPKNPEARIALENTLIKACDRLDKILSDDRRWSIDYQMGLEDEFKKSHANNVAFLEAQRTAAEEVASPHFQHRPKLAKSQDGQLWIAILGDENDLDNAITGIGRTPEEALQEFDKNFQGKENSPEVIALLKKRAEDQQNYDKKESLDGTGRLDPETVDSGGEINAGHSASDYDAHQQLHSGAGNRFGPINPAHASCPQQQAVSSGQPTARRGSEVPRKAGLRKVANFLSRFFRLDKGRAGR